MSERRGVDGTAQGLVPGVDYPRSLPEFMVRFPDEAAYARFVERLATAHM